MSTAKHIADWVFRQSPVKRSPEYKAGLLANLRFRLAEMSELICPFVPGTAQADAWWCGADEAEDRAKHELLKRGRVA